MNIYAYKCQITICISTFSRSFYKLFVFTYVFNIFEILRASNRDFIVTELTKRQLIR